MADGNDLIMFEGGPATAFGVYNPETDDNLSDGIGVSYPLIKYKGKVWSLQYKAKNYPFTDPATNYPLPYIDIIILQSAPNKSKSYFPSYDEDSHDKPLCASMDGVVPDVGVPAKQSDTCALCPRNELKLNDKGKNVRECNDFKRLAVLPMPALTERLLGFKLLEPVFLRIPGGSLSNFSMLGDQASKRGLKYWSFVTRIDFDPQESYPKMQFKGVLKLSDAEYGKINELRNDPQCLRIIGKDTSGRGMKTLAAAPSTAGLLPQGPPSGQPPLVGAPGQPAPSPAAVAAQLEKERQERIATIRGTPDLPPNPPTLDLTPNPTPPASPAPPAPALQITSDTGEPEMADEAIDARVAAMELAL